MNKKIIAIATSLVCVFAFCFALVGCGGGSADNAKNFVGDWTLSSYAGTDSDASSATTSLKDLGIEMTLSFTEDGKCEMSILGEKMEGTWEAESATKAKLVADDASGEVELKDGKLYMTEGSETMVFERATEKK